MDELVTNSDMSGFPGAPFSDQVLQAAAESVRDDCGWHIAPSKTETLDVDTLGAVVMLPSLNVEVVSEVRDAESGAVLDGWRLDKRAGILHRRGGFPARVEVDLTHGYEACPPALKPVIADRAKAIRAGGFVRQESLGSRSVTLAASPDGRPVDPLSRYRIG